MRQLFDGVVKWRTEGTTAYEVVRQGVSRRNRHYIAAGGLLVFALFICSATIGLVKDGKPIPSFNPWAIGLSLIGLGIAYNMALAWRSVIATARERLESEDKERLF